MKIAVRRVVLLKDQHGGDIWSVAQASGTSPEAIIDFSASINPLGLSKAAVIAMEKGKGLLTAYPDPYAAGLTEELARYHAIPAANIIAANGSNELIYLLAQSLRPGKALIIEPAFSEYRRSLEAVGCAVDGFRLEASEEFCLDLERLIDRLGDGGYDMCFLTNPTSHVGGLIPKTSVIDIIEECRRTGTFLVIDEAFCDFTESGSLKADVAGREAVIVLRSMTKFFAMAGLRLGYAVASENIIERLASLRPTWSVNLLATLAGIASLRDKAYIDETVSWFTEERPRMEAMLSRITGFRVFPGAANFFLCRVDESVVEVKTLRESLLRRGVLIRSMSGVEGLGPEYFRVALRGRVDNELLASLLSEARRCEQLRRAAP